MSRVTNDYQLLLIPMLNKRFNSIIIILGAILSERKDFKNFRLSRLSNGRARVGDSNAER